MVHSAGLAFGPRLNPIGRGGPLVRWPKAGWRFVDAARGHAAVARLAHASRRGRRARRGHRGRSRRGGAGGPGSPASLVQRGRRREYEDGEGRSLGKMDGDATHQGG
jgi:hypothetical protein